MPYPWPADTVFTRLELQPQNRDCPHCSGRLRLRDHRPRRLFTFDGLLHLVCKLAHCPDPLCPQHYRTVSPEDEAGIALPRWIIGWDVFAWIGHLVQEGPTLVLTLDAPTLQPQPFPAEQLRPYWDAKIPECQRQALHRRTIMRRARSKKQRPRLLAELERRYQGIS